MGNVWSQYFAAVRELTARAGMPMPRLMAISRSREYEADRRGAELLGTGEPLARALEKLEHYSRRVPMNVAPAQASHFIVNPLAGRRVGFANLFRTHPSTEERVRRLRGLA